MSLDTSLTEYRVLTANDIAIMTGGNYRTVKKLLGKMVAEKELIETTTSKNNKDVTAYYTTPDTIKNIQASLRAIRQERNRLAHPINFTVDTTDGKTNNNEPFAQNAKDEENVTIREVIELQKKNNELENRIIKLQLEVKDLEIRNTILDSDNKMKDKDILLITDRSNEVEKNYFEKVQEVKNLEKNLKNKNILLVVLLMLILIACTIALTIYLVKI